MKMTKCDFCTRSKPNGKCEIQDSPYAKICYCKKAIEIMVDALKK